MMKTAFLSLISLLSVFFSVKAENVGSISYFPVVTGNELPQASSRLLKSKMEQILTGLGYGSMNRADRFVMLAKCNVLEKDVAPTTPPRISQKIEVTFILGDAVENKTYASATFELLGIGTNETKAWQAALGGIKSGNEKFRQMFDEANEKIELYYAENCENIIAKSRTLASLGQTDEAIANLIAVPDICSNCHDKAMAVAIEIYQNQINTNGAMLLTKAKNAWSASPDEKGAEVAMSYLNEIHVSSSSFTDAEAFAKIISDKLSSDKEREWQLKLKKYNDEKEFRTREQANSHARSMASIAAARSVAEKWAENQLETKVYLNW